MRTGLRYEFLTALFLAMMSLLPAIARAEEDALALYLSQRDASPTFAQLVPLAGGEEPLIDRLIALKDDSSKPAMVGLRAQILLMGKIENSKAKDSVLRDLRDARKEELKEAIIMWMPKADDGNASKRSARREILREALSKANSHPRLRAQLQQRVKDGGLEVPAELSAEVQALSQ